MTNGLHIYIVKFLHFSSYIRNPFLIYHFATDPIWITFEKKSVLFFISAGWYSFSYGFLVLLYLFHHCFIVTRTQIHFVKCCFIKTSFESTICCNILCISSSPLLNTRRQAGRVKNFGTFFYNLSCTLYISMYVQCTSWYTYFRPQFYYFFGGFLWTLGRKENHRPSPMDLKI